jgi:hypothetical protein
MFQSGHQTELLSKFLLLKPFESNTACDVASSTVGSALTGKEKAPDQPSGSEGSSAGRFASSVGASASLPAIQGNDPHVTRLVSRYRSTLRSRLRKPLWSASF